MCKIFYAFSYILIDTIICIKYFLQKIISLLSKIFFNNYFKTNFFILNLKLEGATKNAYFVG